MIQYTIYVIDDEQTIREGLTTALKPIYKVETFSKAEPAIMKIKQSLPDVILLDIGLPGISGIDALREVKNLAPEVPVIMITAYEDIDTVIAAMKLGAYDYVVKPIQMDALEVTIANAVETIRLRKEVKVLQEKFIKENLPCFIGESDLIQDMIEFMGLVAKSPDTPILILGETGTGKELIASAIHYRSPNFKGNFIALNCAAIPKDLIESELFGYERGAFSGANAKGKKGLIEEAQNGTLFLDEVGDLSPEAQAKLLRFLENGEFYRTGGTKKRSVQTRVVSATNKDLDQMISDGQFRSDLFYRLGVIKLEVPSLNERPEDILPLANYFLNEFGQKFGKSFQGISEETVAALIQRNWQGNVRELKNVIERGVLVGKGPELQVADLGIENSTIPESEEMKKHIHLMAPVTEEGVDLDRIQKTIEKYYIEEALKLADGNESQAARLLNINHHTFRYRKSKLFTDE